MSGKLSNHNEIAETNVKIKDSNFEKSSTDDKSSDLNKNSDIKEEVKQVNGIVKDDFEKKNTGFEKETKNNLKLGLNAPKDAKMENGFDPSSEQCKENQNSKSNEDTKNEIQNIKPNGLETLDTNKSNENNSNTNNEKNSNTNKMEENSNCIKNSHNDVLKNGSNCIEIKIETSEENSTIQLPPESSKNDSKTNETSAADINSKETQNHQPTKSNTEKVDIKDDDENNDVIIIGTTEGVIKNKENTDSMQKYDGKNSAQKMTKAQTGNSSMNKSDSSVNMSSSASSSSTPSLGDTSMTAFARLLHDLGVELVRQHVYKDLVEIQVSKDAQNKLNEREKEQLAKLEEFYAKQEVRNAPYNLKEYTVRCKCRVFASESKNVMRLHQEYGRIESGSVHVCCCCKEFKSRWPSHYIAHMKTDHDMVGRLRKKMSPYRCSFCSYEAKNQLKIDTHMITCSKRFVLACNLQPLPADTDIPLKRRYIQTISYSSSQNRYSSYLNNSSSTSSGYSSIYSNNNSSYQSYYNQGGNRSIYNNSNSNNSSSSQQSAKDGRSTASKMEICEICGSSIFSRPALLNHLQIMHKVKLNVNRGLSEPIMSCDRCSARFWTYQGLAKHATMVHKSSTSSSMLSNSTNTNSQASNVHSNRVPPICHICGDSQTFNPLNHMSTRHNITLLDMYQVKQCYICNKALKNGPNFQEHMVLYHRDIFANKDVLHTVLQALSAARHLKREESSNLPSSNYNKFKKSNQPITSTPISSEKSAMFNSGITKSAPVKRRISQVASTPVTRVPEKEKKTTEQERIEMEKLYENLAGIGRPILRSMKQRMSSGSASQITNNYSTALKKADPSKLDCNLSTSSNHNNFSNTTITNNINNDNKGSLKTPSTVNYKNDNIMANDVNRSNNGSNNNNNVNNNNNSNLNNYISNNIPGNANPQKNPSMDKSSVQDLKRIQQEATSEPQAKKQKVDDAVILTDSN